MPYDHGKGVLLDKSEYKKEYVGHVADPVESVPKHESNIHFGDNRYFNPAQKEQFRDFKTNDHVVESQVNTQGLKLKIKHEGKYGQIFKGKEEPVDKYDRGALKEDLPQRPGKWVKGALVNRNTSPFDPKTTNNLAYRGHSQDFARKQDERFDNLKNIRGAKIRDHSAYKEQYSGHQPDNFKNNTLKNINKNLGNNQDISWANPDFKSQTTYVRDYSPKPNHINKTDDKIRDLLHQFHGGYYKINQN